MIFFMHIAKTAGTTVNSAFQIHFGDKALVHAEGNRLGWKNDPSRFEFISGHIRLAEFEAHINEPSFKFTLLRDPIEHLRSHLHWLQIQRQQKRFAGFLEANPSIAKISDALQGVDIADAEAVRCFLDTCPESWPYFDNCQSRYFNPSSEKYGIAEFRGAVTTFERFDFVGTNAALDASLSELSRKLKMPLKGSSENVESYGKTVDRKSFRKTLSAYLRYDCALFEMSFP